MDLILGLQKHFLLPVLAGANGFVDEAGSLGFCGADFPFRDLLPIGNAQTEAQTQQRKTPYQDD